MNLPPRTSLLHDKKLGVQIIRQLLTEIDIDTVNDGWIHYHLDELSWDVSKVCPPDFLTFVFAIDYIA